MSSLSDDNKGSKRQRTKEVKDNRIVVNVGGKLFPTFRSTLTMQSTYFEKRLSGRFSDDAGDSEIIVDRDHEPFSIILSYLRSGKLSVLSDQLTLRLVLIEADFYGIDELVDMVRDKCYCNLNHIVASNFDESSSAQCLLEFPTYEHIINHPKFPSMYFSMGSYCRIISTQILPQNKYVRINPVDTMCYFEVWQAITYERLSDSRIFTEPALTCREPVVDWTTIIDPLSWPKDCLLSFKANMMEQHIPVSFWLGLYSSAESWHICTKSILAPNETNHKYTVRVNGLPETKNAELVEIYTLDATFELNSSVSEYRLMAYANPNLNPGFDDLVNVKELDNFMHFGSNTIHDI